MAYPTITSAEVMSKAAALMNDAAKSIYPYTIQLPYLNMALQSLQEEFELNNIPVTDTVTSSPMVVPANAKAISFTSVGGLVLPSDLVEPKILWERTTGIDPYIPMTKLNNLPRYMEGVQIGQLVYFTWQSQEIRFLPANQSNDVKMDYVRNLFSQFADVTGADSISVINSASYLEYETAALLAQFCAENPTRAQALHGEAINSLDRALGIGIKGRQSMNIRHRPFRSGFKRRSFM